MAITFTPEEIQQSPQARMEAQAQARALHPQHLVEVCRAQKGEAERATRSLRQKWQEWWDLWQSEVIFPDKEEWQSQLWIPKSFVAVEQATSVIRRVLMDSPDFFGVRPLDPADSATGAKLVQPLLRFLLDQAGFKEKYLDACKVGFILGISGYLKYRWSSFEVPVMRGAQIDPDTGKIIPSFDKQLRSMLSIDFVLPWNIFRDPDSQARENFSGTYLWHDEWRGRPVLQEMIRFGWDAEAVGRALNKRMASDTTNTSWTLTQRREFERKQMTFERHKFRRDYLVSEGWLDIVDENGDVVMPDALVTIVGDEVVYGPVENPLWATDLNTGRRKWPFVAMSPISHPSRFEGRGILEQDAGLSWAFVNTFNLLADAMNWVVNPDYEVYEAGLTDWESLERYPGKAWAKNVASPVLSPANTGGLNFPAIMGFLQYIDGQRENSNFVTQFVQGLPGTRADITKGEVQIKTGQSLSIFETMGWNYEHGGRAMIALTYDFAIQYLAGNDFTSPAIISILGPEAAALASQWTIADRIERLQGQMEFTFTGVSQALSKAESLQKLLQFATIAASGPYAGLVPPDQILRAINETMGLHDRIEVRSPQMGGLGLLGMLGPGAGGPQGPAPSEVPGAPPAPPGPSQMPNPLGVMRQLGNRGPVNLSS